MRELPAGSGDDGAPDPALTRAVADGDPFAIGAALVGARLLVPVSARVTRRGADGADRESETELVLLQDEAGRQAMVAFTGYAAFTAWSRTHRPVRGSGADVAAEALERGCHALVLDPAGPEPLEVTGATLRAVAAGRAPGVSTEEVSVRLRAPAVPPTVPDLGAVVAEAYALEASTDGGASWQAVLGVVPAPGATAADLVRAAGRAGVGTDLLPLAGPLLGTARRLV